MKTNQEISELEDVGENLWLNGLDLEEALHEEKGEEKEAIKRGWLRMQENSQPIDGLKKKTDVEIRLRSTQRCVRVTHGENQLLVEGDDGELLGGFDLSEEREQVGDFRFKTEDGLKNSEADEIEKWFVQTDLALEVENLPEPVGAV